MKGGGSSGHPWRLSKYGCVSESGLYSLTFGSRKPQKGSKKLPLKFQGQVKKVK